MSDFTPKNYGGLTEAYASIYRKDETVNEEHLDQEIQTENVDCDPEVLVDVIVEHLVTNGYVKTENQALDMIPHIGDTWLDGILGNFVLEQSFINGVNSLLDEGCDLSSYTVDELYENYISNLLDENGQLNLNEAVPALLAAPMAGPAIAAGLTGLVGGAAKLYQGMQKRKPDAASERWLKTGSYEAKPTAPTVYKAKVTGDVDAQSTTRQQRAAQRMKDRQAATSSTGSGGSGSSPTPPGGGKGPNWKDILLGKTKAGLATRVGGATVAGSELYGSQYGAYSPTKLAAGLPLGAAGLTLQGAAGLERFGKPGGYAGGQRTTFGYAARDAGETLGRTGAQLITQPGRKPATNTDVERQRIQGLFGKPQK